jgi:hypothetical protein
VLSFAYKWSDSKRVECKCLPHYLTEYELIKDLWSLFDEADVIIAHNLDHFDAKQSNSRFIAYGLKPPSPYATIDTLKIAKKYFRFPSNKLSELSQYLKIGQKPEHSGIQLWFDCLHSTSRYSDAWIMMRRYNRQDVVLLEKIYEKLRPWMHNHPNLSYFTRERTCPVCNSHELVRNGFKYLKSGVKQSITCRSCGHHFTPSKTIKHDIYRYWE